MENDELKKQFDKLYETWLEEIRRPEISFSSNPYDYTRLESFHRIEELGKTALPYVLEKIKGGDFLMNHAALKIAGASIKELTELERKKPIQNRLAPFRDNLVGIPTEQQKSALILANLG